MRGGPLLVAAILGSAMLAGCVGGSELPDEAPVKQRAEVTDTAGGIEGLVTDNAIQPIAGIDVLLVELEMVSTTADDGSFAFALLAPGAYTLRIESADFVAATQEVRVRAGAASVADFVLVHIVSDAPYESIFERSGFIECGVEVGADLRDEVAPATEPADATANQTAGLDPDSRNATEMWAGYAVCSEPNSAFPNTTNDKFNHFVDFEPPLHTLMHAMVWDSTGSMSGWMTARLDFADWVNARHGTLFRVQGPSVLETRVDREELKKAAQNFLDECDQGAEAYCGYSYFDDGWNMVMRVFPAWQCQTEDVGICAPTQQPFTHYFAGFYNAAAPEGHSLVPR